MNNKKSTATQLLVRLIIILAVLGLLVLISIKSIQYVPQITKGFINITKSIPSLNKEKITLSLNNSNLQNKDQAVLTYKQNNGTVDGTYTIQYACLDEAHIEKTDGTTSQVVYCNQPFYLSKATSTEGHFNFVAYTSSLTSQTVNLVVTHKNASSTFVSSSTISFMLRPAGTTASTTPTATTTPTPTKTPTPTSTGTVTSTPSAPHPTISYNPNLPADLSATVVSTSVNKTLNQATIKFLVSNKGGKYSGSWKFNASLPVVGGTKVYTSPYQASLAPQSSTLLTLTFDAPASGQIQIAVNADTGVIESSTSNNTVIANLVY